MTAVMAMIHASKISAISDEQLTHNLLRIQSMLMRQSKEKNIHTTVCAHLHYIVQNNIVECL